MTNNKTTYRILSILPLLLVAALTYQRGLYFLCAISIIAVILYAIYTAYDHDKENTSLAVPAALTIVGIIIIAGIVLMNPTMQEDIKEGDPLNIYGQATIEVNVENPNIFVGKDCVLLQDGKILEQFHLDPKTKKVFTITVSWPGSIYSHNVVFRMISTELYNIIQNDQTEIVTVHDKEFKKITF